ncbi:MAG: response regulator, partial [bacterium]
QTFEVAAQHAFDLSLRNDPDDARQQVLALTECASRLQDAVRTFMAAREQQLRADRAARGHELASLQRVMIILALLWGLIVALLTQMLRRRVMSPIDDLSAAVRALGDGADHVQVATQRYQEFQLLADSFDSMAERVRSSQNEVTTQNDALVRTLEDLRRAQHELVQREKLSAMGEMIAGLAHELNNPLAGVLGLAECLDADLSASDRIDVAALRATVTPLISEAIRARDLVRNLLHFSREASSQLGPVPLSSTVDVAIGLRRHAFTQMGKTIQVAVPANLHVLASQQKLELAIINVMNNALDAMTEFSGSQLRIEASREGGMIALTFTDDGPGFKNPARSFDPFYTTKPVGAGTGLGLSLVHRFVHEFGGSTSAENVGPGGARVILRLQAAAVTSDDADSVPPAEATPLTLSAPKAVPRARHHILVVDDEPAIREVQRRLLARIGADVTAVSDGEKGRDALRGADFDLVITDLRMPGTVSGRDLLEWIANERPALSDRVIVMTGDAVGEQIDRAALPPAERIVLKPFSADDYLACVGRILAMPPRSRVA